MTQLPRKLQVIHYTTYLPHQVKFRGNLNGRDHDYTLNCVSITEDNSFIIMGYDGPQETGNGQSLKVFAGVDIEDHKGLMYLRPLTWLNIELAKGNGYTDVNKLRYDIANGLVPISVWQTLVHHLWDVYNLIPDGLAFHIDTQNPVQYL